MSVLSNQIRDFPMTPHIPIINPHSSDNELSFFDTDFYSVNTELFLVSSEKI